MTEDRIVVGVDGSSASLPALQWASQQASVLGAPLHVVTAWYHDEMLDDLSAAQLDSYLGAMAERERVAGVAGLRAVLVPSSVAVIGASR